VPHSAVLVFPVACVLALVFMGAEYPMTPAFVRLAFAAWSDYRAVGSVATTCEL
jgi:hypothetical protein